jgi:hypothetical protein
MGYLRTLDMDTMFGPESIGDAIPWTLKWGMPLVKMYMLRMVSFLAQRFNK